LALLYANGAADDRSHTQLNSSNLQLAAALQIESLSIELGPDAARPEDFRTGDLDLRRYPDAGIEGRQRADGPIR
jgi:hypothetical protein